MGGPFAARLSPLLGRVRLRRSLTPEIRGSSRVYRAPAQFIRLSGTGLGDTLALRVSPWVEGESLDGSFHPSVLEAERFLLWLAVSATLSRVGSAGSWSAPCALALPCRRLDRRRRSTDPWP